MKRVVTLLFLFLIALSCFAQVRPENPTFLQGTSDPGSCAGLTFVWREDTHVLKVCYDTTILALTTSPTAAGFTAEDSANKDTTVTLGASDVKYPSQKAVKTYVDAAGALSGSSTTLGGSPLAVGACSTAVVAIASAATTMAVVVTPVAYPGNGTYWHGYVSSAGNVTVSVCASVDMTTPTTRVYRVRVIQ